MVSIIIPIYNIHQEIAELTDKCLYSIKRYTKNYELILIDNKYGEQWKQHADIYIKNEKNNGYGAALNQGAELANREYLVFMNNDVEVTKNWSEPLIEILKNRRVAVAFPKSKNKEDDDYFERLAGFCWFIRRDLFNKLGRIDESFGIANFEDTDFYMRAKSKGYLLRCSTKSKIKHYSRATCDRVPEVAKLYEINEKKYFDRWGILPLLD